MNAKKQRLIGYMGLMFVGVYAVALGLLSLLGQVKNISLRFLTGSKETKKRQQERQYWIM
jgi:hypothetical protein